MKTFLYLSSILISKALNNNEMIMIFRNLKRTLFFKTIRIKNIYKFSDKNW